MEVDNSLELKHHTLLEVRLVCRQFIRCLKGQTLGPASLTDEEWDEQIEPFRATGNQLGLMHYLVYRLLAQALHGQWVQALATCREADTRLTPFDIFYVDSLRRWVHALALCQALRRASDSAQREAIEAELAPLMQWLARWGNALACNYGPHGRAGAGPARLGPAGVGPGDAQL